MKTVWGMPAKAGPLVNGIMNYDEHPTPVPSDLNIPPSKDNGTHSGVNRNPSALRQVEEFLLEQPAGHSDLWWIRRQPRAIARRERASNSGGLMRALVVVALVAACGPSRNSKDGQPDALIECMQEGQHRCTGATYETCVAGQWTVTLECPTACVDTLGCVQCTPGPNAL